MDKKTQDTSNQLAIVDELYMIQKQYNTPIALLPNDGVFGNLTSNAGVDQGGFTNGGVLKFSQRQTIRTIEFYSNSRYLLNQNDELGREKPFYNIVNAICDIEDAAKDIDTKDVQVVADDEHYVESFLLTKDIHEWMKRVRLGAAMNKSKQIHTRYGNVLAKKVIKKINGKKEIYVDFPEWKNLVCDQIDIINGVIVEKHYLTRSELFKKKDIWNGDRIKQALKAASTGGREYSRFNVYEMRGMFPRSYFKQVDSNGAKRADDSNDTEFSYQYYVLAEVSTKNCIPLYWEDDTEEVYKFLARKPKAGRAFGMGVVEENEQAQIWINDTVQKQQRAFEYSSKVLAQSASKKLKSRNVLTEADDGQILEHEDGKPIETVSLLPSGGLQQFQNMIQQWWENAQRNTSAYDSQAGEKANSGVAFRTVALNTQQSQSVFSGLKEELGMFWEDIFNDWIVPYKAKELNAAHILSHQFSPDELNEIDKSFATWTANQKYIEKVLSGGETTQEEYDQWMQTAQQGVKSTKTTRFLQVPKDYYKDMVSRITINISGDNTDKQMVLDSLNNILQAYIKNPMLAQDSVATKLFMEIVEQSNSGISPISLMAAINEQAQKIQQQQKNAPSNKVGESINFKDLPPDGQVQMAQQAGIKIQPPAVQPQPNQQQPQPQMQGANQ